ncbi:uncharacterized protein BP01DRAFT_368369 [Aspergillus saccharolyticus JOP 1030-1]|uniref:Uncharacterized protein n=1 Tax=Aspergillus saccharolyticus JOP 1030-1 TaxID=1450539 RepID=A0A319A414_9EURO|nr:hypothetical protein BP01DRAFT_368369 [Aspergillus saccharolyticus JOP 1030-1]PYH42172.1 hypothetical protein BP01DRAFT_368369 [Aspergillus saccharolyticus JOP 1030-1]
MMEQDQNSQSSWRPRRLSITHQIQRALRLDKLKHRSESSDSSRSEHAQLSKGNDRRHISISIAGDARVKRLSKETRVSSADNAPAIFGKNDSTERPNELLRDEERRATKRLEADRTELEKRLLRLEQNEAIRSSRLLKRGTRRLSKKQPLDLSIRASSVSADEHQSSTRLSSMISISRRSSQSRPSSAVEADRRLSQPSASTVNSRSNVDWDPASHVGMKVPERFSTEVSKELNATNALLSYHEGKSMQKSTQLTAGSNTNKASGTWQSRETNQVPMIYRRTSALAPETSELAAQDSLRTSDLDRTSFSAALNIQGRCPGRMPLPKPAITDTKDTHSNSIPKQREHHSSKTEYLAGRPHTRLQATSLHESCKTIPARSSCGRPVQRRYRSYLPSPLAAPSVSGLTSEPVPTKAISSKLPTQFALEKPNQCPPKALRGPAPGSSSSVLLLPSSHHGLSAPKERADFHRPSSRDCNGGRSTCPHKRPRPISNDDMHIDQGEEIDLLAPHTIESRETREILHSQASLDHSSGARLSQTWTMHNLSSYGKHGTSLTRSKPPSGPQNPQAFSKPSTDQRKRFGGSLSSLDNPSRELLTDEYNTADEGLSVDSLSRDVNDTLTLQSEVLGVLPRSMTAGADTG